MINMQDDDETTIFLLDGDELDSCELNDIISQLCIDSNSNSNME